MCAASPEACLEHGVLSPQKEHQCMVKHNAACSTTSIIITSSHMSSVQCALAPHVSCSLNHFPVHCSSAMQGTTRKSRCIAMHAVSGQTAATILSLCHAGHPLCMLSLGAVTARSPALGASGCSLNIWLRFDMAATKNRSCGAHTDSSTVQP